MTEKKYNVYDGSTKIASDMSLDMAIYLIKGYVDTYFNQPLDIRIEDVDNEKPIDPPVGRFA